ncbi:DUF3817 domain-containing protein [Pontivivens insulae]|uniref:DUF3817 domain-containing protein n=1 Tax=Pontivivens insulae TaxID=1639689 RepID=A0A2R8AF29_9RHOB|nr:DUF3817 domain-containing protein [Pontivivens insulae]RED12083.1 integral membrane protein [Pontivivens insulae]SPF30839.1 hypothetical protein POI8812_03183 [Pontivivens insulae]
MVGRGAELRLLRRVGRIEGATLLLLLFVAVPARRLFGFETATGLMGPIHGVAFTLYFHVACAAVFDGRWSFGGIVRVLGAALIPFGTFLNERLLTQQLNARGLSDV